MFEEPPAASRWRARAVGFNPAGSPQRGGVRSATEVNRQAPIRTTSSRRHATDGPADRDVMAGGRTTQVRPSRTVLTASDPAGRGRSNADSGLVRSIQAAQSSGRRTTTWRL